MAIDEYSGVEILPCPFCNGQGSVVTDHDSNGDDYHLIECNGCTAMGPASDCYLEYTGIKDSQKERISAINKWNKQSLYCLEEVIRQAHAIGIMDKRDNRPLNQPYQLKGRIKQIKKDIELQLKKGLIMPFNYDRSK